MVEQWPGAYRHGDAGRGTVRCVFPLGASDAERGGDLTTIPFDGTRIFERLPAPAWTQVPSSLHSPLEQRIKSAFDPGGILNPGILGEVQ
jgi:FAD/FMN-containing dehydrogenase